MPELNLKQITDKLNIEFIGDTRKLVFWYDSKAEFADEIDTLELTNAKVYKLEPDNQFYTKYFLERVDRTTSYLIYAPFSKPNVRDNHLEDTLLYSKQFFADRASLLIVDLGIDEKYKPVLQQYIKFFGAKDRTQRFYDLEIENFNKEVIEIALMSVLCKTKIASFEEVVRIVLTDDGLEENKFLGEFEKYDLLPAFWWLCGEQFGYTDQKPTLEKLVLTLFVTYTQRYVRCDLPKAWKSFISYKPGSIIAFLDSLMNNVLYQNRYNELSAYVANSLNIAGAFKDYEPEVLIQCETFTAVDSVIISWIKKRLLAEDTGAKLAGYTIPEVCELRTKMHFGGTYKAHYMVLENAFYLIGAAKFCCPDDFKEIADRYIESDYSEDAHYRNFYYWLDQLTDSSGLEQLRDLVENIYTNEFLSQLIPKWNAGLVHTIDQTVLPKQSDFFTRYIRYSKDRVVVIASDALRYEAGQALFEKLQRDAKCTAKIESMVSVLPSYTKLGMVALLPHKTLEMDRDYRVLADGSLCDDLKQREALLQKYIPNSRCVQFDDLKTMKIAELRQVFTGMEAVYVYHNQIDARGDKANTENEVFVACAEAIEEIFAMIKRLSENANTYHFIVTADHGFIYKRDKLQESDKIANAAGKGSFVNRRFIISDQQITGDGICSIPLAKILGGEEQRDVYFPIGANVFKVAGGGQNYVHGGSSPQEMILPVIDVKVERGAKETRNAEIALISMVQKITNLITSLDFIQTEPVSDVVKEASYRIYFISDDNEKISNENIYVADKKDAESQKRIFRLRFSFKNMQYDKNRKYYLVVHEDKNDLEILRHEIIMDLAFANDFGFNV